MAAKSNNRFNRHPLLTSAGLLIVLLLLLEGVLRLLSPPALTFAYNARQIYRYHPVWYTDYLPSRSTRFELSRPDGTPFLDFGVATNQFAFRDQSTARDSATPSSGAALVVHAIGDSYTMGWGVGYEESYPAQLERLVEDQLWSDSSSTTDSARKTTVLNLGLNGFGAIGATGKSLDVATTFPPDAVVYLATENDYDDDLRAVRHADKPALVHGLLDVGNWLRRHSYLASTPFALRWRLRLNSLEPPRDDADHSNASATSSGSQGPSSSSSQIPVREVGPQDSEHDQSLGRATKEALANFRHALSGLGEERGGPIPLLVVLHGDGPVMRDLQAFCEEIGIAHRRILFTENMLIPGEGHLNPDGNERVARYLIPWLQRALDPGRHQSSRFNLFDQQP